MNTYRVVVQLTALKIKFKTFLDMYFEFIDTIKFNTHFINASVLNHLFLCMNLCHHNY